MKVNTGHMLSIDVMRVILDDFLIRPGGLWCYDAELDDDDPAAPKLELTAYTRNSRDDRYFEETVPDDLPVPLTFTMPLTYDDRFSTASFIRAVCQGVAMFAAHEALEWTRFRGEIALDPHEGHDVSVTIR